VRGGRRAGRVRWAGVLAGQGPPDGTVSRGHHSHFHEYSDNDDNKHHDHNGHQHQNNDHDRDTGS